MLIYSHLKYNIGQMGLGNSTLIRNLTLLTDTDCNLNEHLDYRWRHPRNSFPF